MYFSINPSLFDNRLSSLKPYLDSKNPYVLIEADSLLEEIRLKCNNTLGYCEIHLKAKVADDGFVLVDAELVSKIVRTYVGQQIHIRTNLGGTKLMISMETTFPANRSISVGLIVGVPNPQAPLLAVNDSSFEIECIKLSHILASIKALKSDGNVGQILSNTLCIKTNLNSVEFAMASTRGLVIGSEEVTMALIPGSGPTMGLINIDALLSLPTTKDVVLTMYNYSNVVVIKSTEYTVIIPQYTMPFVDYKTMLSTKSTGKIIFSSKDMLPLLRRISLLSEDVNSKSVALKINNTNLEVSLNSSKGEYADYILCISDNITGSIGFMIQDLLSSILAISSDKIRLSFTNGAVLVQDDDNIDSNSLQCIIKQVVLHTGGVSNNGSSKQTISSTSTGESDNPSSNTEQQDSIDTNTSISTTNSDNESSADDTEGETIICGEEI